MFQSSKSRSREATPENSGGEGAASTIARLQKLTEELRASRIAERQRRQQATARRYGLTSIYTMLSTDLDQTLKINSNNIPFIPSVMLHDVYRAGLCRRSPVTRWRCPRHARPRARPRSRNDPSPWSRLLKIR